MKRNSHITEVDGHFHIQAMGQGMACRLLLNYLRNEIPLNFDIELLKVSLQKQKEDFTISLDEIRELLNLYR